MNARTVLLYTGVALLILGTGMIQGWNSALLILNMGLVSAIMSLGINLQWGFAGLLNVGVMGFVALGGLAVVLVSMPPVAEAWAAGGWRMLAALLAGVVTVVGALQIWRRLGAGSARIWIVAAWLIAGVAVYRWLYIPSAGAIESVNPAVTGYLGGFGLPVLLAWPAGAVLAAGAAWLIGKTALGLRSDYLAIATLGIAEIIVAIMKNEDWLTRGVKNVIGLPRPVPYEIDLQNDPAFVEKAAGWGIDAVTASTLYTKVEYGLMFAAILIVLLVLSQLALASPWGRMMRAIRDNETAAAAMGKDVKARHLQVFIIGSAICGLAGAMMTTLDGQLVPTTYQPLRFTFLIWVMVIVGGSGNNFGAVLGGILIWWLWVQVEPLGQLLLNVVSAPLPAGELKDHILSGAAHMRMLTMGIILLLVMRFSPRGLLPER